jgi:hypothetical protein
MRRPPWFGSFYRLVAQVGNSIGAQAVLAMSHRDGINLIRFFFNQLKNKKSLLVNI